MNLSIPDIINGSFASGSAVAVGINILRLYRDKQVKGFHFGTVCFFTAGGLWNLYYYPHLGQYASLLGGLAFCLANLTYTGMTLYYLRRQAKRVELLRQVIQRMEITVDRTAEYASITPDGDTRR